MGILTSLASMKYLLTPSTPAPPERLSKADIEELNRMGEEAERQMQAEFEYIRSTNIYHIYDSVTMWIVDNLVLSNGWLYFLVAAAALFILLGILTWIHENPYTGDFINTAIGSIMYLAMCACIGCSVFFGFVKLVVWLFSPATP